MELNVFSIFAGFLTIVGAIVIIKILSMLLPMDSVRKISDDQKRKGFDCFYVRFRYPTRKRAVMCLDNDAVNFFQVSLLGRNSANPFLSFDKSVLRNLEKINQKRIYRVPFRGRDQRFRPSKEDIKFTHSGKLYALTLFGKFEKLLKILEKGVTARRR